MKKFLFVLFFALFCFNSYAIDYKVYYNIVNAQISAVKKDIKVIKRQLKTDKNSVEFNKALTYKELELEQLIDKKCKIRAAESKYKELVKANEKFNKEKTALLKTKQESADLDKEVENLFNTITNK
jgi:hypothetical protein